MITEEILTDEQIIEIARQSGAAEPGSNGYVLPVTLARAIEQAVLQSPAIQALYGLLKEARQQLPLAAACWNEDENRALADSNAKRVLDLIARIDAAMQEQKT